MDTGILRGGEEILTIGFGLGPGEWGVIKGPLPRVRLGHQNRRQDRRGQLGRPHLMNGSVAGMVTSLPAGLGVAKSAIVVQSTLRGWDIEFPHRPLLGLADPGRSCADNDRRASAVFQQLGRCVESEV